MQQSTADTDREFEKLRSEQDRLTQKFEEEEWKFRHLPSNVQVFQGLLDIQSEKF